MMLSLIYSIESNFSPFDFHVFFVPSIMALVIYSAFISIHPNQLKALIDHKSL